MDNLYRSGFAFFADRGNGLVEFENKFTGLRIIYNVKTGEKSVGECAI
jgi:hypothetical protein